MSEQLNLFEAHHGLQTTFKKGNLEIERNSFLKDVARNFLPAYQLLKIKQFNHHMHPEIHISSDLKF